VRVASLIIAATSVVACRAPPVIEQVDRVAHRGAPLPDDRAALLSECDRTVADGPAGPDVLRSLLAAEKLLTTTSTDGEAAWRAARAVWLMGLTATSSETESLSERCLYYADLATTHSESVSAPFYAALCMGARAQAVHMEGLALIKKMIPLGQLAVQRDPAAHHGGPHRLLGGIYLWAPSWPTSVGDPDEAIMHLEKAAELGPNWPENHLILAQAYYSDDRVEDAKTALAKMQASWDAPGAAGWRDVWQPHLDKLQKKIAKED